MGLPHIGPLAIIIIATIVLIIGVPWYRGRARRRRIAEPDTDDALTAHSGQQSSMPATPEGKIVVLSYPGRMQADAAAAFGQDAQRTASFDYTPVAQSWAEGRPGFARVVAIGNFSTAMQPAGYLPVTYQKRAPDTPTGAGKVCPTCAETMTSSAIVCRYCGHEFDGRVQTGGHEVAIPGGPGTGFGTAISSLECRASPSVEVGSERALEDQGREGAGGSGTGKSLAAKRLDGAEHAERDEGKTEEAEQIEVTCGR